jgi:hypothetical protein
MADTRDLETRLARLEAESEIRKLKARYLNACDTKDVETIRACFTEDAVLDYAPMGVFGLDGLIEIFTQIAVGTPIADSHQIHNGEIDILDADHAQARWSLGFATYDPRRQTFRFMSGLYHDEYVRTAAGWRVAASRHEPRLVVDARLASTAFNATVVLPQQPEG